jgi:hypothetical protein
MDMAWALVAGGVVVLCLIAALFYVNSANRRGPSSGSIGNVSGAVNFGNAGRDINLAVGRPAATPSAPAQGVDQAAGGPAATATTPAQGLKWFNVAAAILGVAASVATLWGIWLIYYPPHPLPGP